MKKPTISPKLRELVKLGRLNKVDLGYNSQRLTALTKSIGEFRSNSTSMTKTREVISIIQRARILEE